MKPKLILCLALVLSGGLFGCSSIGGQTPYSEVTNAINDADWSALRKLTTPEMTANRYISLWESEARSNNPIHVAKLVRVENSQYNVDGQPCMVYSFALEYKNGKPNPHLLQVLTRKKTGRDEILDFWEFGW